MVHYNYLKNNDSDFPHVGNIDVFKYDNDFDYGRFDYTQMDLMICTVPWDMGEAHIGTRTISGIGNVVYFGSKEKRDAWFDAIPDSQCYRFTTKFKELHREHEIDVPIPFDMASKHNYLVVKYSKFANDGSPVEYEGNDGMREWFWFIREVEFLAPNTTRLHLLDDAFQTWIYDVDVSGMVLERGHAPMFETTASEFLSNPVENCDYLLTEDVNYGEAGIVKDVESVVLNDGTMYACIATTSNPLGSWGTKSADSWKVPSSAHFTQQGQPSTYVFCMATSDLNSFLSAITSSYPQFKQTVQGVWFASEKLVTLGSSFTFAGITCHTLNATRKTLDFIKLDKSMFDYPTRYADMAKLYTTPYAHIEITDENGNVDVVKIEDSTGTLKVNAAMNIAYPFISIDAQLSGVGGSVSKSVSFKNITSHSINIAGQWYETLHTWNVPLFAVVLDPESEYDYSTHFDRIQRVNEYTTAKTNADASADTQKDNEDASADTLKANEDASADTIVANADIAAATNTAIAAASNDSANSSAQVSNTHNQAMTNAANYIIGQNATSTIEAAEQQAAVGAVSSAATGVAGAIGAAASGNVAGAVSSAIGGLIGAASTMANMTIANALTATQAGNAQTSNSLSSVGAQAKTGADATIQTTATSAIANANNANITGQAANDAATKKANATRSQTTQKANATRSQTTQKANATRDRDTAAAGIANDIAQAALRAPFLYGSFENGETSTTKPMALFAHIVTQSKHAIRLAGDEFARYGYTFDGQWDFDGNWNVGKYFTYWKLRDFWVSNLNVPDMYMDRLRFFLFGGVTVWRKPEYIGNIDIYDNF